MKTALVDALFAPLVYALLGSALFGSAASAQTIRAVTEEASYAAVRHGKVVGPATDVVEATLRDAGFVDYRIDLYPWARAYDMALQTPNVLIYLIARTPAREAQFKWVGEVMRNEAQFYKLRERKDIVVNDLNDAKRYAVGVVRGDVRQEYLRSEGFTKLVVSAQNSDTFKRLLNGQAELVPMSEHEALQLCAESHVDITTLQKVYMLDRLTIGLYMAYSRSTADDVVARTRLAFERVKASGTLARLMPARR